MSEASAGVRSSMDQPSPDSPAVTPRPNAVPLLAGALGLVLLAGQPAFLGDQAFTTGAILRGAALLLVTAAALFCAWTAPGARAGLGRGRLVLVLLPLGIALLSLPAIGGGWRSTLRSDALWLVLAALPLGLVWTWSRASDGTRTLRVLLVAGLAAALLVALDALLGHPAVGPFGRTGVAGPVLAALAVASLALPLRSTVSTPLLRWAPFAVFALTCVATRSRTGILALLIASLVVWAWRAQGDALRKRRRMIVVLGVTLLVVVLGLMVEGMLPFPGNRKTVDVRLGLHRASLAAVGERPMTGHGAGSYAVTALRHRDLEEARLEPGRRARHGHFDALHTSVEGGVPAGLLFVVWIAGLLAVAVQMLRSRDDEAHATRLAAFGMLTAIAIAGCGDGVLIDPAPVLLFAVAAAITLWPRPATATARLPVQVLPLALGLLCMGGAYVASADALSDRSLMRYRHAIATGVTPDDAARAARQHLEEGALRWRPDEPEALYRLGVHHASLSRIGPAKEAFRAAFRADAGLTEARLDLAQVYQLEDRPKDARAVLEEARRQDPTRYDVPRRVFEIELGPEPVPGDAPTPIDELEVLRWMNLTASLAPDRFENYIDQARFERRRATDRRGLQVAGGWLRAALKEAPGDIGDPPAEILIESFRLAEYENKTSDLMDAVLLITALGKNPRPARRFGAEAARFLDIGQERETAALERAGNDPTRVDMREAQRAFDAAAVRMTALLYAGQDNPEGVLQLARIDRDAGHFRRALARYRALLAWTLPDGDGQGARIVQEPASADSEEGPAPIRVEGTGLRAPLQVEAMARQGDLLLEAASVAHRVDRPLSNFYRTQGQLRIAYELLLKARFADAVRKFRTVLDADPDHAEARFGLARALAREGDLEQAEGELIAALRLKPALREPGRKEPDLAPLRERPQVRLRLGLP